MIPKAYLDLPLGQMHHRYVGPDDRTPIIMLHQNTSASAMRERTMDPQSVGVAIADFLDGLGA